MPYNFTLSNTNIVTPDGTSVCINCIIDTFKDTFIKGMMDVFTLFGTAGPLLISVFFLVTMMLLISGAILTVYFIVMTALSNARGVHL